MLSQNVQVLIYQMQYINIEVRNTDISFIMNSVKKLKNMAHKREHRATVFGTVGHEKVNAQQRKSMQVFLGLPRMKK